MIVLKILAAPFVVVLTVLAAVVSFLFCMATAVFVVACVVLTLLAVALFISGQTLGGIVFLVLAFLISPYGIPAIAEWLVPRVAKHKRLVGGVVFVDEVPKLASGKIQRKTMREWAKRDAAEMEKQGSTRSRL